MVVVNCYLNYLSGIVRVNSDNITMELFVDYFASGVLLVFLISDNYLLILAVNSAKSAKLNIAVSHGRLRPIDLFQP